MAQHDVYKVICTGTFNGSTGVSACHVRVKPTTPEPTAAQFATLASDWINVFRPVQISGCIWRTWRVVQVRGQGVSYTARRCLVTGGRGEEGTFTTNNTGTGGASEFLPNQCAFVQTLKTGLVGRSRRGRVYVWGMGEVQQDSGAFSSTVMTNMATAWATWLAKYGFSPAGTDTMFEYGVWSHRIASGCVPRKEPPYGMNPLYDPDPDSAYAGITAVVPKQTVYTQRRRVAGVGI